MIYLHGVNHESQHRGAAHDENQTAALEHFVRCLYSKAEFSILAEEYSEEACLNEAVAESVCSAIARDLNLTHLYCDPTSKERRAIGIPAPDDLKQQVKKELGCKYLIGSSSRYYELAAAQYHARREEFWLERLAPYKDRDILFVCGSAHTQSFTELLNRRGWEVAAA